MSPPLPFLLGLLVVLANRELTTTLAGESANGRLLPFAAMLLLPVTLAFAGTATARAELVHGTRPPVAPRVLLRLSALATPLSVYCVYAFGGYGDFVTQLTWNSHLAGALLSVAPIYVAELLRIPRATLLQALVEIAEIGAGRRVAKVHLPTAEHVRPLVRLRRGWPLVALLPITMLGLGLELLQLHRELYVFCLGTSVGTTLSSLLFLLLVAAVLPFWFRCVFALDPRLPEPVGALLRATAAALRFPPARVLLLPTGMRALNAMMVGPLPIGRLLCLTDGLVDALDPQSLRGVLAHEIGHARMGHPALLSVLAVVVPLLAIVPLRLLDLDSIGAAASIGATLLTMTIVWLLVRSLAHRFEHEADIASVRALGAEPCCRALAVVSRLAVPVTHGVIGRITSLHPEEGTRIAVMQRYEREEEFRGSFDRRGRQLRLGIAALVAVALGAAAWSWRSDWRFERIVVDFHTGRFAQAAAALAAVETVPDHWRSRWPELREEVQAALEIAPDADSWHAAEPLLAARAWPRGVEQLLALGPAAARPWFELALAAAEQPTPVQRAIAEFCAAAADGDDVRLRRLERIIVALGVPAGLEPVFASPR